MDAIDVRLEQLRLGGERAATKEPPISASDARAAMRRILGRVEYDIPGRISDRVQGRIFGRVQCFIWYTSNSVFGRVQRLICCITGHVQRGEQRGNQRSEQRGKQRG